MKVLGKYSVKEMKGGSESFTAPLFNSVNHQPGYTREPFMENFKDNRVARAGCGRRSSSEMLSISVDTVEMRYQTKLTCV